MFYRLYSRFSFLNYFQNNILNLLNKYLHVTWLNLIIIFKVIFILTSHKVFSQTKRLKQTTVVLLTGALGFMVYKDDKVSFTGNQAIKDQRLALKWVHDEIRKFGGDPNKVQQNNWVDKNSFKSFYFIT